eukprot:7884176-Alexandrium_andersonii.AAC.1
MSAYRFTECCLSCVFRGGVCARARRPLKSASGATTGTFRSRHRTQRTKWHKEQRSPERGRITR